MQSFSNLKASFHNVTTVLGNFDKLMNSTNGDPTKENLRGFVKENFEEGQELEKWSPPDYKSDPAFLADVKDPEIREFAKKIVEIWPELGRKVKGEVQKNPEQYSLVYVDNGLIVPGGRFREFYYWDSYWIINGLILSEMCDTARGMIENHLSMVQRYGFVPNGGRVYYLQRSQPPLLTGMAAKYIAKCQMQPNWLETHIDVLAQELKYWLNKTVEVTDKNGKVHNLARYTSESKGPRPESYSEDYNIAKNLNDEVKKQELYNELKSAAESGWDFSSRWFFDVNGQNTANLSNIETRRVIPVDLNAFLYGAFSDISNLYNLLNKTAEATYWSEKSNELKEAIKEILWNEHDGIWYDYDLKLKKQRNVFSASNASPLWTRAFNENEASAYGNKVFKYLTSAQIDILSYLGGIPTTLELSGEQWDNPNCWPPLQAILVQGLDNSGDFDAKMLARTLGERWVHANLIGFTNTNEMFEKYDANTPGGYGGGGEYVVQSGFGWTNGVVLEFIDRYFRS